MLAATTRRRFLSSSCFASSSSSSSSSRLVRKRPATREIIAHSVKYYPKQQPVTFFSSSSTTTAGNKAVSSTKAVTNELLNIERRNILPWEIVSSAKVRNALPYIGHGAYIAIVSGFCMTDMLTLRLALVGGYSGLVMFHALHPKPLRIPLGWSALFIFVNAGAAAFLVYDQFGAPLSEEEERLYLDNFANTLTRGQFYQLLQLGNVQELSTPTILTQEGQPCDKLYFIQKGKAKVYHHNRFVANIHSGGFVNDVAFQQQSYGTSPSSGAGAASKDSSNSRSDSNVTNNDNGGLVGAYGTVITSEDCKLMSWKVQELKDHLKSRPDMERNMKYTLSQHLMKALLNQREARYEKLSRLSKHEYSGSVTDNTVKLRHRYTSKASSLMTRTEEEEQGGSDNGDGDDQARTHEIIVDDPSSLVNLALTTDHDQQSKNEPVRDNKPTAIDHQKNQFARLIRQKSQLNTQRHSVA